MERAMLARVTRRELLVGTGAAAIVVGSSGLLETDASTDHASNVVAGTDARTDSPDEFQIATFDGQLATIKVTSDTPIRHQARTNTLQDLSIGDEVVAEGGWDANTFVASYVASLYYRVMGTLIQRQDDTLLTTGGSFLVNEDTIPWPHFDLTGKPIQDIQVGDDIQALTWRDPIRNQFIAAQIGVHDHSLHGHANP